MDASGTAEVVEVLYGERTPTGVIMDYKSKMRKRMVIDAIFPSLEEVHYNFQCVFEKVCFIGMHQHRIMLVAAVLRSFVSI